MVGGGLGGPPRRCDGSGQFACTLERINIDPERAFRRGTPRSASTLHAAMMPHPQEHLGVQRALISHDREL